MRGSVGSGGTPTDAETPLTGVVESDGSASVTWELVWTTSGEVRVLGHAGAGDAFPL